MKPKSNLPLTWTLDAPCAPPKHSIEPELRRPPPRKVEKAPLAERGFLVLFCLLFFFVPFKILISNTQIALTRLAGHDVSAHVISRHQSRSNVDPNDFIYSVEYRYLQGNREATASDFVREAQYRTLEPGAQFFVHAPPSLPGLSPYLVDDAQFHQIDFESWLGMLAGFVGAGFVACHVLVQPLRARRLIENGLPSPATIMDKTVSKDNEGNASYFLCYKFSPGAVGADVVIQGEQEVTKQEYEDASLGEILTVLYWPHNSTRSTLYRYQSLRIVSEAIRQRRDTWD
ncbi:MAG: hypothetical protein ABIY70_13920 [Capsulimonas sp.]|uniref:hypothetical protein n=1 Tax=Capsulimonas sp. TaxID=2494211 RepID=UPI00326764D5